MGLPNAWVLLCGRTGADRQALALAEAVGLPFESMLLSPSILRRAAPWLGASLWTVKSSSRRSLRSPWPGLVIAVGRANVPVARWIRKQSGGRTRIVFLGNPRIDPSHLDLVVTTPDYLTPRGRNVLVLPMTVASQKAPTPQEVPEWFARLPNPRSLFLIGGPVKHWSLDQDALVSAARKLAARAEAKGGSLIVCGSPRTPDALMAALETVAADRKHVTASPSRRGGIDALLVAADDISVTGDSLAMITEAMLTGKQVGIMPLQLTAEGERKLGREPAPEGANTKRRDLRRVWNALWADGLAGTLDEPKAALVEAPATTVAVTLLSLLDGKQAKPHEGER